MWASGCSPDMEWVVAQRVYGELRRRLASPLRIMVSQHTWEVWPVPSGFLAWGPWPNPFWVWDVATRELRSLRPPHFDYDDYDLPPENLHVLGWTPNLRRPSLRLLWYGHVFVYPEGVRGDVLNGERLPLLENLPEGPYNAMRLYPDRLLAVAVRHHHGSIPALAIYEVSSGSSFPLRSLWAFPVDRLSPGLHYLAPKFTSSPTGHRTFYGSFPGVRYALVLPPGGRGFQVFWLTHGLDRPETFSRAAHTPWTSVSLHFSEKEAVVFYPEFALRWRLPKPEALPAPVCHVLWSRGKPTVLWLPTGEPLLGERVPVAADVLERGVFRRYRLSIPKHVFQDVLVSHLPAESATVSCPVADGFVLLVLSGSVPQDGGKRSEWVYLVTDRHLRPFWTSLRFESRDDRSYPPQSVPRISLRRVEG